MEQDHSPSVFCLEGDVSSQHPQKCPTEELWGWNLCAPRAVIAELSQRLLCTLASPCPQGPQHC